MCNVKTSTRLLSHFALPLAQWDIIYLNYFKPDWPVSFHLFEGRLDMKRGRVCVFPAVDVTAHVDDMICPQDPPPPPTQHTSCFQCDITPCDIRPWCHSGCTTGHMISIYPMAIKCFMSCERLWRHKVTHPLQNNPEIQAVSGKVPIILSPLGRLSCCRFILRSCFYFRWRKWKWN